MVRELRSLHAVECSQKEKKNKGIAPTPANLSLSRGQYSQREWCVIAE